MTAKELIKILEDVSPDREVVLFANENQYNIKNLTMDKKYLRINSDKENINEYKYIYIIWASLLNPITYSKIPITYSEIFTNTIFFFDTTRKIKNLSDIDDIKDTIKEDIIKSIENPPNEFYRYIRNRLIQSGITCYENLIVTILNFQLL